MESVHTHPVRNCPAFDLHRLPHPTPRLPSTGNHAGCLALAASLLSIPAHIVMPSNSSRVKLAATAGYGAHVTLCEPSAASRRLLLEEVQARTGAVFVPPYDAVNTILGQGTVWLEMEQQSKEGGWGALGAVVVPVGGGGLLSGVALAAKGTGVRVFGAGELLWFIIFSSSGVGGSSSRRFFVSKEPKGADDCARGVAKGERVVDFVPDTIADGVRTPVGVLNFPIIQKEVEEIITVSDEVRVLSTPSRPLSTPFPSSATSKSSIMLTLCALEFSSQEIIEAMRLIYERLKIVVEPTGALAFAAVRSERFKELGLKGPVGILVSGGNLDLSLPLPWIK